MLGGDGPEALRLAEALYGTFVSKTVRIELEAGPARPDLDGRVSGRRGCGGTIG